jgi:hypothetical protein
MKFVIEAVKDAMGMACIGLSYTVFGGNSIPLLIGALLLGVAGLTLIKYEVK